MLVKASDYVNGISDKFVEKYKDKMPPWGPIGYISYKRTYARRVEEEKRTEEWYETVKRCCNGIIAIGGKFTKEEIELLYDKTFNLKCSFSGRALWQLGTETVKKLGGDSLQNCWCLAINDPIKPFTFAFNELMLGGGVGFNLMQEYVYEMPRVKYDVQVVRRDEKDVNFVVPDNREGWVELLSRILNSFFFTGKSFTYSTICVRSKGAAIKGFGGVASGPEDLCAGMAQICNILRQRVGKKLRPLDCLDIMNIIGDIVVAGNVRRSAQLALGDGNDNLYLDAKNWAKIKVPKWRGMSNNSISTSAYEEIPQKFWEGYNGDGEPYGLINLKNCRAFGRTADGKDYRPDRNVVGTNPCGEVPLAPYEACNLGEIFLPNIKDEEEFGVVGELIYKVTKTISALPFIHDETNQVVSENHRLGIGVTGFLQAPHLRDEKIFDKVYKRLEKADKEYSKVLGIKPSIKLTTTKPSGTLSLLPGVTPGVHPAYSPYYIRRVRMATNDPLVEISRNHGFHIEPLLNLDGSRNHDTMVVSYPVKAHQDAICAKDLTAVQQLDHAKWLQTNWSDNSVSVTVYYKQQELPEIKSWLEKNYDKTVKSVSFLLHSGHGFAQAPYEEITEAAYKEMAGKTKPISKIDDKEALSFKESMECVGGSCPIK